MAKPSAPKPGGATSAHHTQAAPADCPAGCELGPGKVTAADPGQGRAIRAFEVRCAAAADEYERLFSIRPECPALEVSPGTTPPVEHDCNGDEVRYQGSHYIGNFTKGLPHDPSTGEVDDLWYCAYLKALDTGTGWEDLLLGCGVPYPPPAPGSALPPPAPNQRKLEDPQAGYAYDLQGADSHALRMPPPPAFAGKDEAVEMLELYWMALARDVPFTDYGLNAAGAALSDPLLEAAYDDLRRPVYGGYWQPAGVGRMAMTRPGLFRGFTAADQMGPYLSQFFLYDVPYGAQVIPARIRTVLPGVDYLTEWTEWLAVQNGCDASQTACDPTPRYIRSGRDLAQFVHVDNDFYVWFSACNVLVNGADPLRRCEAAAGLGVEFAAGLPYNNSFTAAIERFPAPPKSKTQIGVGTFGPQHIKSLVLEAMIRAVKAVWYQKWMVHRRLRPEEYGGFVDYEARHPQTYPIPVSLFESPLFDFYHPATPYDLSRHNALQNANKRNTPHRGVGSYLLPMAYAEGSPLHPSYGQGHATIAGACATILKAFFDEKQKVINPMQPNRDGTALELYTGADRDQLTLGGELNKLAGNIALGRDFAGVHWRSDYTQSLLLGEKVAISLLFDQRRNYHEGYQIQFTRFDGTSVTISAASTVVDLQGWLA